MRELGCGFLRSGTVRIHGCLVCEGCPFVLVAAPHPNPLPVKTGRGDVPYETRERDGEVAAYPLRPVYGGPKDGSRPVARPWQWRQPDEGLVSPIS